MSVPSSSPSLLISSLSAPFTRMTDWCCTARFCPGTLVFQTHSHSLVMGAKRSNLPRDALCYSRETPAREQSPILKDHGITSLSEQVSALLLDFGVCCVQTSRGSNGSMVLSDCLCGIEGNVCSFNGSHQTRNHASSRSSRPAERSRRHAEARVLRSDCWNSDSLVDFRA